jgi:hypothetical protein
MDGHWSSIFGFAVIATISKFSVLTGFVYRAGLFVPNEAGGKPFSAPFRIEVPNTGLRLAVSGILLAAAAIIFVGPFTFERMSSLRRAAMLVSRSRICRPGDLDRIFSYRASSRWKTSKQICVASLMRKPSQYITACRAIAEKQQLSAKEFAALSPIQLEQMERANTCRSTGRSCIELIQNPVEFAGMLTALAGTFFVSIV